MLVESQFQVINAKETLALDCSFQADVYNLFDYPVLWRKAQEGEETQINIMGNINEPFMATNRFDVTFISDPPKYNLQLSIICRSTVIHL